MSRNRRSSYDESFTDEAMCDSQLHALIQQTIQQTMQAMESKRPAAVPHTEERAKTVDLIGLFFFIVEKFWFMLLSAVLFAGLFGWSASRTVPTYTATAKLYIVNPTSSGISISDLQLGTVLTLEYQEVFKTWEVHEMVREELGLPYSYEMMQAMLTVTNPEDTRILYITVTNSDAQMAAGILTLIFVLYNSPKTPEDINKYAGISTLAILPIKKKSDSKKRAMQTQKVNSSADGRHIQFIHFPELDVIFTEGFNTLVTSLSYCGSDIRKIMITSRFSSEGKSYVTMNLMRTLAGMGRKVVVVDTDLRASGIQMAYGLRYAGEQRKGLSEYLAGHCAAENVIYQTDIPNAWIIPAGHTAPNPLQLLDTDKMKQLIDSLAEQFDIVLLDTPPIGILVDAIAMAKFCDGAALVVGYHQGKLSEIGDAVRSIRQTGCPVLGAVLNEVKLKSMSNRHYYYHSRKYSGYYKRKRSRK